MPQLRPLMLVHGILLPLLLIGFVFAVGASATSGDMSVTTDTTLAEEVLGMRWRSLEDTLDAFDSWARGLQIIPTLETDRKVQL